MCAQKRGDFIGLLATVNGPSDSAFVSQSPELIVKLCLSKLIKDLVPRLLGNTYIK